jgi:hypothetical protein
MRIIPSISPNIIKNKLLAIHTNTDSNLHPEQYNSVNKLMANSLISQTIRLIRYTIHSNIYHYV